MKIDIVLSFKIMMQSGHNFAHVKAAQLSWHVQNYGLIPSSGSKSEQNKFSRDLDYELINPLQDASLVLGKITLWGTQFTMATHPSQHQDDEEL